MHDHPWQNTTLVLAGGYVEQTPAGRFVRRMREIVQRAAEDQRSIVEVMPGTITLFQTGGKVRDWGFYTDAGFVPWQEFHAKHDQTPPTPPSEHAADAFAYAMGGRP